MDTQLVRRGQEAALLYQKVGLASSDWLRRSCLAAMSLSGQHKLVVPKSNAKGCDGCCCCCYRLEGTLVRVRHQQRQLIGSGDDLQIKLQRQALASGHAAYLERLEELQTLKLHLKNATREVGC